MSATRPFAIACACLLFPAIVPAQPAVPAAPAAPLRATAAAAPRTAWFERYQDSKAGPAATEQWNRVFKVGPEGSFVLNNLAGDIVVTGGDGQEIRVDAVKRVRARDGADPKQLLSSLVIDATESAGRVVIQTNFPRGKMQASVDYTVVVPWNVAVSVRGVSSDIQITKVKGEVQAESVSGDVALNGIPRLAKAKSVSGDVEIADASAGDALEIGTVSGNLSARNVKARSIEIQTVSGDLALVDSACERAQVRSVSGNVQFGGTLAKGGRYEFNSHSGDVLVWLGGSTGFQLTANTFSGHVRSELPLSGGDGGTVHASTEEGRGPGHHPGRQLRGTFGDGSALVSINSFSGSVTITSRDSKGAGKVKDKPEDKGKPRHTPQQ